MFFTPRKQIRLHPDEYLGPAISFVTICCESGRIIFHESTRAQVAIEALKRTSQEAQFSIHAYCLMPDHVHFLVEGTSPGSNLVKFVSRWKQQTGYLFRNDLPKGFWQRRFYDHILRSGDQSESVAWYIWDEPCAKRGCSGASSVSVFRVIHVGLAEGECACQGLESAVEETCVGRIYDDSALGLSEIQRRLRRTGMR